ncbi:MAG: hypothetical protein AAGJ52_11465 [Pseudomonadota bacterium]
MSATMGAPILLLGASSACGQALIQRLAGQGVSVLAVSRQAPSESQSHVIWVQQDLDVSPVSMEASVLVSTGPLIHAIQQLEASPRIGRVIAMSSASTEFKARSDDAQEQALIQRLMAQESELEARCADRGVTLTLLKPTLIYGGENNRNVDRIGGLADRLRWLPYCGQGRRHPVHADDLARLILDCVMTGERSAGKWLLGGGETLDYPSMLRRIASARGQTPRLLRLPLYLMKSALVLAHAMGKLEDVKAVMLERQRLDLIVDDQAAREQLAWQPRGFRP